MNQSVNHEAVCRISPATPVLLDMTVIKFSNKIAWKYGFVKRKVGLRSANLVFAFIGVRQAQVFGCACLKPK